jgi:hypothetical protein
MHWIEKFLFMAIQDFGVRKLAQIDGTLPQGSVDDARLKPFTPLQS